MPELPEVEVLVRALRPLLLGRRVTDVVVRRRKSIRPGSVRKFGQGVKGARFHDLQRRGKYLLFELSRPGGTTMIRVLGHLGMTGRMYVAEGRSPLPKHAAVVLRLGPRNFVFEDMRYFGRLSLDVAAVERLGPEPLGPEFTPDYLYRALRRSSQAVKIKLLDQHFVAGIGNIYASEALHRAGISPRVRARRLSRAQAASLCSAIREVLAQAIARGSTVPLNFSGTAARNRLFYFGTAGAPNEFYDERLRVYDRLGRPCPQCAAPIKRLWQAGRSTYYCPKCQKARRS